MNPAIRTARSPLLLLLVLSGLAPLLTQTSPEKTDTVIRRDAALVTVDVIAVDKHGVPIQDLRENEIKVMENGKEQKVLHFEHISSKARRGPSLDRTGWTNN